MIVYFSMSFQEDRKKQGIRERSICMIKCLFPEWGWADRKIFGSLW